MPTVFANLTVLIAGLVALAASHTYGQVYPTKPIRIISSTPGGGGDTQARLIAQGITNSLGQAVIVENRTSGFIQVEAAYRAAPDGYTLLQQGSSLWNEPLLHKAPYDAERDLTIIAMVTQQPNLLVVTPSLPVKSVKELIALARAHPGELNNAHIEVGGSPHMAGELFKTMAKVKIVGVSFRGLILANYAVSSGDVQLQFADPSVSMPMIKSGRLRALAVTSLTPWILMPALATVAESIPGYEWEKYSGIWAPAKTPEAIIARLNQEIVRLLGQQDAKDKFLSIGQEAIVNTPQQAAAIQKKDTDKASKLIRGLGITVE